MISLMTIQRLRMRHARRIFARLASIAILAGTIMFPLLAASADNTSWYVAADVGQTHFTGISSAGNPIAPGSFSSTDTGYRLSVGYKFNSYFGLEASYVDLGKVTGSHTYIVPPCTAPDCLAPQACPVLGCQGGSVTVDSDLKTHGWTFEFVGRYPFNDHWAIFGRAGGIQANSELDTSTNLVPSNNGMITVILNNPSEVSNTSTDFDATYGLGVQWSFASNWVARLSWDRYASIGHNLPMGSFNVNLTSLGIVYQF